MIVAEIPKDRFMELGEQLRASYGAYDPLEALIENWAQWCSRGGLQHMHVRAGSVGQGFKHYDTEGGYIELDIANARTVDAIIWGDLTPLERAAVSVTYLGGVWSWLLDIERVLDRAKGQVRVGCVRKGLLTA